MILLLAGIIGSVLAYKVAGWLGVFIVWLVVICIFKHSVHIDRGGGG